MQRFCLPVGTVSKAIALTAFIFLQQQGFVFEDVNKREVDGSTPLQWAVYEGDVAEVERLIKAGADVALANNYGATAAEMLRLALEGTESSILRSEI